MLELLSELLRIAIADESYSGTRLTDMPKKDANAWDTALNETRAHRVTPLLGYMLRSTRMDRAVPAPFDTAFANDYRQTLVANTQLAHTLEQVIPALSESDIKPIVLKGALLADAYYPDLGTRPMGDIDLLIQAEELDVALQIFGAMGFTPHSDHTGEDATKLCNSRGITIDLHDRFTLFPPDMRDGVTEEASMRCLAGQPVKCWEPNAQLVHVLVHQYGHRPLSGLILGWLLDLAFIVRRDGERLCPKRIEDLMPDSQQLKMLWRALGFLSKHAGLVIPSQLRGAVESEPTLRLPGILRDQRLARWGLPSTRGWLRLLACHLHLKSPPTSKYPSMSDLAHCLRSSGRD